MDIDANAVAGSSRVDKENWLPVYDGEITSNYNLTLSQGTDYGDDISALILQVEEDSTIGLGKRKASDSEISDPMSGSNRPVKLRKSNETSNSVDTNEPYIITYSPIIQPHFTADVPYGVQYEIARLISLDKLRYEEVSATGLNSLRGSNIQNAPETARTFVHAGNGSEFSQDRAFAQENAAKSPWEQLDIEETALAKDEYAGLGHSPDYPGWYGGKIEFRGKLQKDDKANSYKIVLERCTLGPSCRFTRRFGSKCFLRIKVPSRILHSNTSGLTQYFRKPFVIWGRVFRAFYAKDDTIFLFRTNEIFSKPHILPDHFPGLSLLQFLEWHNSLEYNRNQTMAKWAARFALGLSNSYPGPMIAPEDIGHEDDIISPEGDDMTDGCGSSNKSTHMNIYYTLKCDNFPVAVQFRLEGCKGMSAQRPDTSPQEASKVWLRPSQRKIKYPPDQPRDPAHLIMDILRTSYMRSPARVSPETIINLAENGVPRGVFVELMKASVANIITGLTTWEGPDAMYELWLNVERAGAVCFSRRARGAAGEARVRGFGDRQMDEDDEDEDEDEERLEHFDKALDQRSSAWWADQISGCPSSLEETVMVLLDSGFTPQECPILREKLKQVVTTKIKTRTQNYRYDIELSAGAFVIPDRYGVLGPDEIQIKSSRRNLKNAEGLLTDIIIGDVLMTRNPCKLPTDIRKVKAVEYPQLRDYVDVIVCTVQGHRRLLDFLAGGDYDGDTAIVIWTPDIVEPFRNADEKYSIEPEGLDKCFSLDNERVDAFLQRVTSHSPEEKVFHMQQFLLGSLCDPSTKGLYSTMHDNAIYNLGYKHPRTIRLAYKFCKVLDGTKTGLRIKPLTLKEDMKSYHLNTTIGPQWKEKKKTTASYDQSNLSYLPRGKGNFIKGPFIMDVLLAAAKQECRRALTEIDTVFSPLHIVADPHLLQPWDDATQFAERGSPEAIKRKKLDLSHIAVHVQAMYTEHRSKLAYKETPNGLPTSNGSSKRTAFTKLAIEVRQDILRALSKKFASAPRPEELDSFMDEATIARLRASYAYKYDSEVRSTGTEYGWSRFPWDVAMRELCAIKARALGPHKTVTTGFYERFKLSSGRH